MSSHYNLWQKKKNLAHIFIGMDGRNFFSHIIDKIFSIPPDKVFKSNCILLLKFFAKMQEAIFFLRQTV